MIRKLVAAAACAALCAVAGCATDSANGVSPNTAGVSMAWDLTPGPQGGLVVQYSAVNNSDTAVIVVDGIPAKDTKNLPEPDPDAAYVRRRPGGVIEVSRRAFGSARGIGEDRLLVRGTRLEPGAVVEGRARIGAPPRQYRPGVDDNSELGVDDATNAVFCLGVADPKELDAGLQGQATTETPVVHHGIRQTILCGAERPLP